uniref:ATP synthase F0 subunit 6 n=1 Tax=Ctenolepisma longicaudatum TaxID=27554 RepID=UPI0024351794|nr:ATP synthase F0 subunit 6 [Ctenolepisma longicaudatum]WEX31824.1 ATP synthase F0 subunit 6 [Ctenolepisma longicaudatum]
MTNLFSIFDPTSSILTLPLNWTMSMLGLVLIPISFWFLPSRAMVMWNLLTTTLHKEIKTMLSPSDINKGASFLFITLFTFIMFNNFMGLFPYIFTSSSHLVFTLTLALPMWVAFMLFGWINNTQHMFAHLLPEGTPTFLIPFIICIEIVSNIIRPGTLSIRLMTNMTAGHVLLTMLSSTGPTLTTSLLSLMLFAQLLMLILESAVAIIQAYVFAMLAALYSSEVT